MSPAMVATIIDYHRLLPWIHHGVCIGYKWPEVDNSTFVRHGVIRQSTTKSLGAHHTA
jgi:hypothetical protein